MTAEEEKIFFSCFLKEFMIQLIEDKDDAIFARPREYC